MKYYKYRIFFLFIILMQLVTVTDTDAGGAFYYSIHGASYQNLDHVKERIASLKADGCDAFYEKRDIPGKGLWYRVYVGKYKNRKKAEEAARHLKDKGVVGDFRIRGFILPAVTFSMASRSQAISASREQEEAKAITVVPPLLKEAISAYEAGKYDQALEAFKGAISQGFPDAALREKAERLTADCLYFLGMKENRQALPAAVEQYKTVLKHYPDPAKGNDFLYYRMATSHEKLKFYYEAAGAWERLIAAYPDSAFMPEAMFRLGDMFHQMGKFDRAIERLIDYLKKYPEGAYAKIAYFTLGDCYYRMRQADMARRWFDEAQKKWPEFGDISRDILMNLGAHDFEMGRYAGALHVFSLYVSLYPADELSRGALYKMARAAEEMNETYLALKLYSLFMEKYPQGRDAEDCTLAMANLGLSKPGLNLPHYLADFDSYLEPLNAYDKILAKYPNGEQAAGIMLLKANALGKYGRAKEAFAEHVELLSRFPRSRWSDESRKCLNVQAAILVNDYFEKGDHAAISDLYFRSYAKGLLTLNDFDTAFKIGESLQKTGLCDDAGEVYSALAGIPKNREKETRLTLALAEIDAAREKYGNAENKLLSLLEQGMVSDRKVLNGAKRTLADIYYKKGLFEKAAPLYAAVLEAAADAEEGEVYRNYGRSLLSINMGQAAIANYLKALRHYGRYPRKFNADLLVDIYAGLGDAYYGEGRYGEGVAIYHQALAHISEGDGKKWLEYRIGQGYAGMKDLQKAESSFARLKEAAEGEFWPKVADYGVESSRRLGKGALY